MPTPPPPPRGPCQQVDHADNVWLLWCNSLRIAPPKFQTNTRRLPLNLAPHFVAPSGHSGLMSNDKGLAKVLSDTDALQFGLSNDVLFARSLVVGQTPKARGAFPKLSLTKAKATSPTSDSTAKLPEVARPLTCPLPETFRSFSESETTPSVSRSRLPLRRDGGLEGPYPAGGGGSPPLDQAIALVCLTPYPPGGGGSEAQKKVCVPEIGLKFSVLAGGKFF